MRPALLLCLVLALPDGLAQRTIPAPSPWMSGAQLLQKLAPPPGTGNPQSASIEAGAYLAGVHDATEGKDWCYTDYTGKAKPKPKMSEIQADILRGLRKLPPAQLERNAAKLVVEIWQLQWPCPPDGCCHD